MKITVICGSHRTNSQSSRISKLLIGWLKEYGPDVDFINLADNPLPLWDEGVWDETPKWEQLWGPIAERLDKSDGFIVVTPEWHGMVPAGLKNFFLLCGGKRYLAHKPAYLVAVSSGMGGAYPIAELRMSSYKNTRICYIPEQMIIRNCETILVNPSSPTELDKNIKERIQYGLMLVLEYTKQLSPIREKMFEIEKKFPSGM